MLTLEKNLVSQFKSGCPIVCIMVIFKHTYFHTYSQVKLLNNYKISIRKGEKWKSVSGSETPRTSELGHLIEVLNIIQHFIISLKYCLMRINCAITINALWVCSHKAYILRAVISSGHQAVTWSNQTTNRTFQGRTPVLVWKQNL